MSPFGLAEQLGISRHEARELIDQYFRQYPGVKAYIERTLEEARREMEGALKLKVPIKVDVGVGTNWLEAHA